MGGLVSHPTQLLTSLSRAAGLPPPQADGALRELTAASVLAEHMPGRYLVHDLLRCYAAKLTGIADNDDDRREAASRMGDHFLHTGNGVLSSGWRPAGACRAAARGNVGIHRQ
jgi:hypothetical protein